MSNPSLKDLTLQIIRNAQEALTPKSKRAERPVLPVRLVSRPRYRVQRPSNDPQGSPA